MTPGVYPPVPLTDPSVVFSPANRYRILTEPSPNQVQETECGRAQRTFKERHIQCVWFDPQLRPADLRTDDGEPVVVLHPGTWNLGPGPDFLNAVFLVGTERRRLAGDVEVHIRPSAWRQHRHADDPRYAHVRAHVTYYPDPAPHTCFPPGVLQIALAESLSANHRFDFDELDLTAYPYAVHGPDSPCAQILAGWPVARQGALLEAAGEERIRRKSERLVQRLRVRGEAQVLYEEILAALGFRRYKTAFRTLAEQLTLDRLREYADGDLEKGIALLLGAAGLLPDQLPMHSSAESRRYLRLLWNHWWRLNDSAASAGVTLSAPVPFANAVRPANHPCRRLATASLLFVPQHHFGLDLKDRIEAGSAFTLLRATGHMLGAVRHAFWGRYAGFTAKPLLRESRLIGGARAGVITTNVVLPWLLATGRCTPNSSAWAAVLPPEADNAIFRVTVHTLFGPDAPAALWRSPLRRQGLLQIFQDFCLSDRTHCAACPLLTRLESFCS